MGVSSAKITTASTDFIDASTVARATSLWTGLFGPSAAGSTDPH